MLACVYVLSGAGLQYPNRLDLVLEIKVAIWRSSEFFRFVASGSGRSGACPAYTLKDSRGENLGRDKCRVVTV
jgi:hypothetical protein